MVAITTRKAILLEFLEGRDAFYPADVVNFFYDKDPSQPDDELMETADSYWEELTSADRIGPYTLHRTTFPRVEVCLG